MRLFILKILLLSAVVLSAAKFASAACGTQGNVIDCNNSTVCSLATNKKNGIVVWDGVDRYIKEARRRGLSCKSKKRTQTKPPTTVLKQTFTSLNLTQRRQIQSQLKGLGFYKSTIDGLYGKETASALTDYNKQNLSGADLKKTQNVERLINAILDLKTAPATVPDTASNDTYKVASGSGFYVSDQGHIITNQHVIDGCSDMKVHFKGKVLETITIAEDRRNDLALLQISEAPKQVFALSLESPFPLQDIIVAGYPFGDKLSSTLKFTQGIVSSIAGLGNDYSQIQIDAALQPGNSGGPILDEYGNVVAVAVAKLSMKKILEDYGVIPENTNFGVKVSAVKNLMEGNDVPFKSPNTEVISKKDLSKKATDGTVFLSCWMTTAQIEQMRTRKVLFEDIE
jgi:S1-C subfamily serine protease